MANAVDDSASPKPTMVAAGQSSPASSRASPASTTPVTSTCVSPSPKIARRRPIAATA